MRKRLRDPWMRALRAWTLDEVPPQCCYAAVSTSRTANNEGTIAYEYDDLGRRTSTSVYPAGADTSSATPERVTSYTYDALGRLASVSEDLDPPSTLDSPLSTSYAYDLLGNMDRIDLPNGVVTDYVYDELNRLDAMTDYAPDGSASPGSPDLDLSNNQKLAEYDYAVRADGKRTAATETFWLDADNDPQTAPTPHVNQIDWTYDDIGRLTDEVFNHFDDNLDQTEHFVYDLTGNRFSKTVDKGNNASIDEAITYFYDANDRLIDEISNDVVNGSPDPTTGTTTTYGYDHTQQTSKTVSDALNSQLSTLNYVYNLQGRMSEVTATESATGKVTATNFEYDAMGIRVASTTKIDATGDGTFESQIRTENLVDHHNFTGYQQSIKETHTDLLTGNVTKTIEYTFGHDEIAQTITEFNPDGTVASEATHIFGHDGHGSVRVLYDSAASILQLYAYSSYGEMLGIHDGQAAFIGIDEGLALTILLYSGEPYYQQIAMQYLRARFYDPATGRFNRLDPFAGNMRDPQSLHKYLYVHGDPVNGVDPTGKFLGGLGGLLVSIVTFSGFQSGHSENVPDVGGDIMAGLSPDFARVWNKIQGARFGFSLGVLTVGLSLGAAAFAMALYRVARKGVDPISSVLYLGRYTSEALGDWNLPPQSTRNRHTTEYVASDIDPRLPVRRVGMRDPTRGIMVTPDEAQLPLQSGTLIDAPTPVGVSVTAVNSLKHVEGQAAMLMQKHNMNKATLTINYEGGPCSICRGAPGDPPGTGVAELLEPGQELYIYYPMRNGNGVAVGVFRHSEGFKVIRENI